MRRLFVACLAVTLAGGFSSVQGAEISVKALPPVVVKTTPRAGDTSVDPSTKEIRVEFSKAMMDKNWSVVQLSRESFPKVAGKPRYLPDAKTCVIPVELKPGRTYAIWLNSRKFGNFKDSNGKSAVPYLLVFETKK